MRFLCAHLGLIGSASKNRRSGGGKNEHAETFNDKFGHDLPFCQRVEVYGNYLFATARTNDNFVVVDVSNPAAPAYVTRVQASPTNQMANVWGMTLSADGQYAYTVSWGSGATANKCFFHTIDISPPTTPTVVASLNVTDAGFADDFCTDVVVRGNYAYGVYGPGVFIINITNPLAPTYVAKASNAAVANGQSLAISEDGSYAYVMTETTSRIATFNVSNPFGCAPNIESFGTCSVAKNIDYVSASKTLAWCDGAYYRAMAKDTQSQILLHADGADASTSILNSGTNPHLFTVAGNTQLDTAQFKFGSSSILLDGTGDYVIGDGTSDWAFGTGDFTVDMWVRFNSVPGGFAYLVDNRPSAGNGAYFTLRLNAGIVRYYVNSLERITGTTTFVTGTWYHVAVTRQGTSTRMFVNGVQEGGTYTDSVSYIAGASRPTIGADGNSTGTSAVNGWIDEFRVSKGVARWTANFTPPTSPY